MKAATVVALMLVCLVGARVLPPAGGQTALAAVGAPVLSSPSDGTQLPNMGFVVLMWSLPEGATQFQVQVTPANNDGPGINLIRDAATSYTVEPPAPGVGPYVMLPGMTYSWRVRATDATVAVDESSPLWGPWSDTWTFRTPAPSAAGIAAVEPPDGATVATLAPRVVWHDTAEGIFYYEVQLSKDPEFRTDPGAAVAAVYQNLVHGALSSPPNSWAVPAAFPLEPGTRYSWRVRPRVQGDGTPVAWSRTFTFTTPAGGMPPTPAATPTPPASTPTPTATPAAGSPTATPTPSASCDWTGTWNTTLGVLGIRQTGSTAEGVLNGTERLEGTVAGAVITLRRSAIAANLTLTSAADCASFSGFQAIGLDFTPVSGTRTSTTPPPIPTASASPTAVTCPWAGSWRVTVQGTTTSTMLLTLTQSGTAVTGTIDGGGTITATAKGTALEGTWSRGGESGDFKFVTLLGCTSFFGTWSKTSPPPAVVSFVTVARVS